MRRTSSKKQMILFSKKVYEVVEKIPEGRVLTYKKVAKLSGKPGAFRAVGNILNKNSDIKKVPCHRVIKSDGRVGGYRFGSKKKAALLKKEGVIIRGGRVVL